MENVSGWFGRFRAWLDGMTVNVFFIQNAKFFQGKGKRRDLSSVPRRRNAGEILAQSQPPRLPRQRLQVVLVGTREPQRATGSTDHGWPKIVKELSGGKHRL